MNNGSHAMPGSMMELRENAYNLQYLVGDRIDFLFNEGQLNLSGIVIKKYTHSCLVDISQDTGLTRDEIDLYNQKIVVNYKQIKGVVHCG
ncbi:DUF2187 family protein [Enterococcus avium]|uniref:DUF2187 family protein n=1 Tax=Enterococcus avium TaxID=33945 RepID=UPI00288E28C5|nr:DUF2187 family protein [Enterococcus avium]MDT2483629.1 DUF2187 family protein [Enterococcus avium]MDT2510143.1 DUF2187 family protein [Enterococcus avium]